MSGGKPLLLLYAFKTYIGTASALPITKLRVCMLLMFRVLDKIGANSNISVFCLQGVSFESRLRQPFNRDFLSPA
jgi:hypothetical protein